MPYLAMVLQHLQRILDTNNKVQHLQVQQRVTNHQLMAVQLLYKPCMVKQEATNNLVVTHNKHHTLIMDHLIQLPIVIILRPVPLRRLTNKPLVEILTGQQLR